MFRLGAACAGGRHLPNRCSLKVSQRNISAGHSLERLERLCHRLKQLQGRVRCPKLNSFIVEGRTFQLPLKAVEPPEDAPERKELEYLVGFFDGDGSVSLHPRGVASLQVTQNVDSAHVLLRFRRALGGAIVRSIHPTGRHKACLKWLLYCTKYGQVASWLGRIASMKQAQLQIAAGGRVLLADRDSVRLKLIELKQANFAPAGVDCSWSYFAGFFDADGYITVRALSNSLELKVTQANEYVLSRWLDFLHGQGLRWHLYHSPRGHGTLACRELASCRRSLELLLQGGLLVKQEQAKLALTLTAANHVQVREAMSKLKGYQSRYCRLDEAGMDRATEIQKLCRRLRSSTSQQIKSQMEEELQAMRQEHLRQNLICKAQALRADIRQLLREGAIVLPHTAVG